MDDTAFDAWTRRRLGLVAGGALAALITSLGLDRDTVEAGKKHKRRRKKRCRRVSQVCDLGGNRKRKRKRKCCRGLQCDRTVGDERVGAFCCWPEGTSCGQSSAQCCSGTCDDFVNGGTCAPCRGRSCTPGRSCCGGLTCVTIDGFGFCGGCKDRGTVCNSDDQCCYSNCTTATCTSNCAGGSCLSAQGGPCARDIDCRTCYLSPPPKTACNGACVNGACTV